MAETTTKRNTVQAVTKKVKSSAKTEAVVYSQEGKEVGKASLPESVFGVPFNADLVHQVVVSMQANARTPIAHTKVRGEVRGGGKKPWRQKGTGRARHGSTRSPIWRGGGITFGPRNERNFSKKVNRKMRAKALYSVISRKMRDGHVLLVDSFVFEAPKSAKAKEVLSALSKIKGFETLLSKKHNSVLLALGEKNKIAEKSFSNFGNVSVDEIQNLNPVSVLQHKHLIISKPEESIAFLESKLK